MNDVLQLVLLELKRQKKESFPDHICAQANRVTIQSARIAMYSDVLKYDNVVNKFDITQTLLKQSLISTMATCLRMLEELEK